MLDKVSLVLCLLVPLYLFGQVVYASIRASSAVFSWLSFQHVC